MDKTKQTNEDDDIAEERYKGPSVVASAAGEGFVSHFKWAAIGLATGMLGGVVLHRPINGLAEKAQAFAGARVEHINFLVRWPAKIIQTLFGHGKSPAVKEMLVIADAASGKSETILRKAALHHEKGLFFTLADELLFFLPRDVKTKWLKNETIGSRINAGALGGGLLASIGYFLVPIFSLGKGGARAHEGRRQFERAQEEIVRLRNENTSQISAPAIEQPTPTEPTSDKKTAEPSSEVTEKKIESADTKPTAPDASKLKGDSGWAEGIQTKKDAKSSAEPALA